MKRRFPLLVLLGSLGLQLPVSTRQCPPDTMYISTSIPVGLGTVDLRTGATTYIGSMGALILDIAFSPEGDLYGSSGTGIYRIDLETGQATLIVPLFGLGGNGLAFRSDGTLFGTTGTELYVYDIEAGTATSVGSTGFQSGGDIAFGPDGELFMTANRGTGSGESLLVRLDPTTGAGTEVATIAQGTVYGLDFDADGVLYGLTTGGGFDPGQILRIDTTTGEATLVATYDGPLDMVWGASYCRSAMDVVIDFETDDVGFPLLHGQSLATPGPEIPFRCPSITGGPDPVSPGNGNNGLAVFDSTSGPFGQDPDLQVDSGKVLYFQANGGPPDEFTGAQGPDTWDHPNDDEDGGSLLVAFCQPVTVASLDLIDIDAGSGEECTVELTDLQSRTRTFSVPAGWTANGPGPSARRTLDLTEEDDQPGVAGIATQVTQAGFDPTHVLSLRVRLGASGALDNLRYFTALRPASVTERNGSGVNPRRLRPEARPILGTTWSASLDCQPGADLAVFELRGAANPGQPSIDGEILVGGPLVHRVVRTLSGSTGRLALPLPGDPALCGTTLHLQGACRATGVVSPSPRVGYLGTRLSNALDLVLGI